MHSDYFQPEKLLAVGPSAKVYRGVETATGRKVLIKVLLAEHETPHPLDLERLQMLAPSLMQVRHPQIAGLITLLPAEDEFVLVYEFMPGISGRALPQVKRITASDVRALAVQLMHALLIGEHQHQPHGDLKPSNLIIANHPCGGLFLQVQDWGLSQARAQSSPETFWFRAPEVHHGAPISSQSDLFTSAASLFFLATGAAPAQGNTPEEILTDLRTFDLRGSLTLMRPDIDQTFIDWLAWLLNPAPEQRPPSVAHALDALMRSMQNDFVYQPQPVPEMAPGSATGPLVPGPATRSIPRPVAPRHAMPRPATSSAAPPAAGPPSDRKTTSAVPKAAIAANKRGLNGKVILAIVLNLLALAALLWFFRLIPGAGGAKKTESTPVIAPKVPKTTASVENQSLKGRYVRVSMQGKGIISLAEMQVFSGARNIASQGTATQSSVHSDSTADRAIDNNTDGDPKSGSITITHFNDKDPLWQLDLGRELPLDKIVIWNRTDNEKRNDQLKNFTVSVLNDQQGIVWQKKIAQAPKPSVALALAK